jgi:hypothetical protein
MAEKRSSGGRSGGRGGGSGSGRGRGGGSSSEPGELLAGPERGTALISGDTFAVKGLVYSVVDDLAIFEGDIVLGTIAEVEQRNEFQRQAIQGNIQSAVIITGQNRRWPNCQVPFDIDGSLPNQARVTDAIAHWHANTRFRFIERTAANAASFPDWVTFRPGSGCSSSVGRQGGQQFVNLGTGCTTGNAIHEIGHTIGLWHEQSREDRDAFVTIHWASIQAGLEHNFDQHVTDGDDVGAYDYGSIMHYPRNAFSRDGSDTITPVDPNAAIGQRTALSAGDIAAANSLCPVATIKEVAKDPITDTVKEVTKDPIRDTRKEVTKDPVTDTRKEVTKDPIRDTRKEAVADTIKELTKDPIRDTVKEATGDPKGPFDPGPGTFAEQPGPIPGPFPGPMPGPFAGPMPFAVATGHQAPGLGAGGAPDPASEIEALDAALGELAQALEQIDAQRAPLQQQYDEMAAALAAAIQAAGGGLA